jgi:hypothetical protein
MDTPLQLALEHAVKSANFWPTLLVAVSLSAFVFLFFAFTSLLFKTFRKQLCIIGLGLALIFGVFLETLFQIYIVHRASNISAQVDLLKGATGQINKVTTENGEKEIQIVTISSKPYNGGYYITPHVFSLSENEFNHLSKDPVWKAFWKLIEDRYQQNATKPANQPQA